MYYKLTALSQKEEDQSGRSRSERRVILVQHVDIPRARPRHRGALKQHLILSTSFIVAALLVDRVLHKEFCKRYQVAKPMGGWI